MDSTNTADNAYIIKPRCVAADTSFSSSDECAAETLPNGNTNFFKSAQWSPDGTCIATNSDDNHIRTYVLPPDLLTPPNNEPHTLTPYTTNTKTTEPTYALAFYPSYQLSAPETTFLLSSPRDHPTRLTNTLDPTSSIVASYPLVNPQTERYTTPYSLVFTTGGTHFLAGADSLLAVFDVSRYGTTGPVERHATIPSRRKKIVGGGVGIKGILSALAVDGGGMLAVGTYTRCVGLYGSEGRGETVAVWSLTDENGDGDSIGGSGVTQVLWSPCGKYLYVAERGSDGIIVYDIRLLGRKVGVLEGRKARTNQRMSVDVVVTREGHEVWAGGTDGVVRFWKQPGSEEGARGPVGEFASHQGAVNSTALHPSGMVLATASGQRHLDEFVDEDTDSANTEAENDGGSLDEATKLKEKGSLDRIKDHSLKIWTL